MGNDMDIGVSQEYERPVCIDLNNHNRGLGILL